MFVRTCSEKRNNAEVKCPLEKESEDREGEKWGLDVAQWETEEREGGNWGRRSEKVKREKGESEVGVVSKWESQDKEGGKWDFGNHFAGGVEGRYQGMREWKELSIAD